MQTYWMICIGILAAFFGFWFGRSRDWKEEEEKEKNKEFCKPNGIMVESPAAGSVRALCEDQKTGAVIRSIQGKIYSPLAGKVTKISPLGNTIFLHGENGLEMTLRAGNTVDDLLGNCYRPRVLKNEVVGKGKLLLEFDREGLLAEGADTDVYVETASGSDSCNITVTQAETVKVGEALLWVQGKIK